MEENTVRVNEIEATEPEVDTEVEVDEVSESSNGGGIVAGIVGGFLAYAAISGAKKLAAVIATKLAERKQNQKRKDEAQDDVVDAEFTEVQDEQQADSEVEAPEEG